MIDDARDYSNLEPVENTMTVMQTIRTHLDPHARNGLETQVAA